MKILAIDTSNQTLAIGVTEDQKVLGHLQTTINKNHSVTLMPAVASLVERVGLTPQALDRIVVAEGPGSYTGLRIGVTTAKTLADTLNCDLVGISSLKVLAANCQGRQEWIVPLFNARRQNVYAGAYQWQGEALVSMIPDQHLALADLLEKLKGETVYFVGEDVQTFHGEITAVFPEAAINQISEWNYPNGIVLANLGLKEKNIENIHGFLPSYLKLVEAEEKWLETHEAGVESYVEKV